MKVEAHQREYIEDARQGQKTAFENELQTELNTMEQKDTRILNAKIRKGDAEPVDERLRYAQIKQNRNMFEDDEDIEEMETPAF